MQSYVLFEALLFMALVAFMFVKAVRAVNQDDAPQNVDSRRTKFIWVMVAVGVLVTFGSLREWPHAVASGGDLVEVNATAAQWSWEIDKLKVPLGKTIVFNLHTSDVNHGFGVADSSGKLLFQVQVSTPEQ
jgi:cytochrome c oxidase subunit 2